MFHDYVNSSTFMHIHSNKLISLHYLGVQPLQSRARHWTLLIQQAPGSRGHLAWLESMTSFVGAPPRKPRSSLASLPAALWTWVSFPTPGRRSEKEQSFGFILPGQELVRTTTRRPIAFKSYLRGLWNEDKMPCPRAQLSWQVVDLNWKLLGWESIVLSTEHWQLQFQYLFYQKL